MIKGNTTVTIDSPHLRLWTTYPTHKGFTKALEYVPKRERAAYEDQWRDWCRKHDKKDYPQWILDWPETKKRLEKVE